VFDFSKDDQGIKFSKETLELAVSLSDVRAGLAGKVLCTLHVRKWRREFAWANTKPRTMAK
jgi:hypothetical protein